MNTYITPSKQKQQSFVLMTGATGLLGQYLLKDFALAGQPLAVVVRPSRRVDATARMEEILYRWERESNTSIARPVILEGDVSRPNLGLSRSDIRWVADHCRAVLHNAAILQFTGYGQGEEPWQTNFHGTRHALELSERTGIPNFHYVSTAYVCGQRKGRVLETELDCGQEFRNAYEQSKFAAEQLVRSAKHLNPPTVYRPAVIAGDSQTGFTSTYHGLFLYLRLIATLLPLQKKNSNGKIETPIKLPMNGNEPRNLVPVDWVSHVITHLFTNPLSHGRTYHLSPDYCITAREFIEYCCDYFNTCGVQFIGGNAERIVDNDFAARFFENASIYQSYETTDPQFDKTNLLNFASQFPCPKIDKEMIVRFIEFGQTHRWGKKIQTPVIPAKYASPLVEAKV